MGSIQEFRANNPAYDDMTDADLADSLYRRFYSDMPRDEFNKAIGVESAPPQTGAILPLQRDAGGDLRLAVPRVAQSILDALRLPGEVASGVVQTRTPEGGLNPQVIERSFDLAGVVTPSAAGGPVIASAVRKAVPLTPGEKAAASGQRLGVDLPVAVTSNSPAVQQIATGVSNVPVAGLSVRNASERAIGQLDDAAKSVQDDLGTGNTHVAGGAIVDDITGTIREVIPGRVSAKYQAVDALVDDEIKVPLRATAKKVEEILARRSNAGIKGEGRAAKEVSEALVRQEGLGYTGLQDLRTHIGELLKPNANLPSGMSQAELKQIYGALSDDLATAVRAGGGEKAVELFEAANRFAKHSAAQREKLDKILGKSSEEGVALRLIGMAGGTKAANIDALRLAKQAVDSDTWNELGALAIAQMGRKADGAFSTRSFLSAYGKLSPQGKRLLFEKGTRESLEDIANVSRVFERLTQFANPSGTSQNAGLAGLLVAGQINPMLAIGTVVPAGVLAKLLSRPKSARVVARWADARARVVLKPSLTARNTLMIRSQPLAALIARESGVPAMGAEVLPTLQGLEAPTDAGRPYNPETDL